MKKQRVYRSKEFKIWFNSLSEKDQRILEIRIMTYLWRGILVKFKSLDAKYGLYEFKWDSGLRVYFAFLADSDGRLMLLLLGGNKNSQNSDIAEAKKIVIKSVSSINKKRGKG